MTEIIPNTLVQGAQGTSSAAVASTNNSFSQEFDSFIRLLTAQLRNQDPLSPLDSTQFVEQLATFSSLEQQVRSNTSLDSIATMLGDMQQMIAAEWLGQSVEVESAWIPFSGDTVELSAEVPAGVDRAELRLLDADGKALLSADLTGSDGKYAWNGELASGALAAPGTYYKAQVDLYKTGQYVGSIAPRILTTVTDVGFAEGKVQIGTSANLTTDIAQAYKR